MKRLLALLLVLVCAFSLFSCSEILGKISDFIPDGILPDGLFGDNNGDDNGGDNLDDENILNGYKIVYPKDADKSTVNYAKKLKTILEELSGLTFELCDDTSEESEKEFLVGMTNRALSVKYSKLLPKDYAIERRDGKIAVVGGSSQTLLLAINYFEENWCDEEKGTVTIEDKANYAYRYPYTSVTIGSYDISDYSILVSEQTEEYASSLNKLLIDNVGVELPVINDIDDATRGKVIEFAVDYTRFEGNYFITLDGNALVIGTPSINGMDAAYEAFLKATGFNTFKKEEIKITSSINTSGAYSPSINDVEAVKYYLKGDVIGGSLAPKIGDNIVFHITLNASLDDDSTMVGADSIQCVITADNKAPATKTIPIESGEVFLTVPSIDQPGIIKVEVTLIDAFGNSIEKVPTIQIGAFVNAEEVKYAQTKPDDYKNFWEELMLDLYYVDPRDTSKPVAGQDSNNYFHIEQIQKEQIEYYKQQTAWKGDAQFDGLKPEHLDYIDVYEFTLKCYGEYPATGFISIPKDVSTGKKYPIKITTCGYGIYRAFIRWDTDCITVSMNTHGRPNMVDNSYYDTLRGTHVSNGGLGSFGIQASDYTNPKNAYYVYVMLRNMQALRFATDEYKNFWDGTITAQGTSQGGFQSIAIAGLATLTHYWDNPIVVNNVVANVPWYCDVGGDILGRDVCDIVKYYRGVEYFDSANFATLIDENTKVYLKAGYADPIVPAVGVMTIYNNLNCPKKIDAVQNHDHGSAPKENGIVDSLTSNWTED